MKRPLRLYPRDVLADVWLLMPTEAGIYTHLIMLMLMSGEPLAEDHVRLARRCNATNATFTKALAAMVGLGVVMVRNDGSLWNKRVEAALRRRSASRRGIE